MQITITCELNARNLEILKQLIEADTPKTIDVVTAAEPPAEAPVAKTKPVDEQTEITVQDIKAVCLKLSKAGKQAELKAAFAKFGGKKLSDIAETDYPALMKVLGDA